MPRVRSNLAAAHISTSRQRGSCVATRGNGRYLSRPCTDGSHFAIAWSSSRAEVEVAVAGSGATRTGRPQSVPWRGVATLPPSPHSWPEGARPRLEVWRRVDDLVAGPCCSCPRRRSYSFMPRLARDPEVACSSKGSLETHTPLSSSGGRASSRASDAGHAGKRCRATGE